MEHNVSKDHEKYITSQTLAISIKIHRLKHNYTQIEMADKLEINRITYSNIESGKTIVKISLLQKLANIYNINMSEIWLEEIEQLLR